MARSPVDAVWDSSALDEPGGNDDGAFPMPWVPEGHIHEALFFSSTQALVEAAVPPLEHALAQGERVVLSCTDENNQALAAALGDGERTATVPRPAYQSGITALAYYRELVRTHLGGGATRVHVLMQPVFDTSPSGWDQWRRFEALCGQLLAKYSLSQICAYDARRTPDTVLATAELSHPYVRGRDLRAPNPSYVDPDELLHLGSTGWDAQGGIAPALSVSNVRTVADVGTRLFVQLRARHMANRSIQDLLCALQEVLSDVVARGLAPVTVRVWLTPHRVVCQVTPESPGPLGDPSATDSARPIEAFAGGRLGMRLAHHLCDELVTSHTEEGFSVRITKCR